MARPKSIAKKRLVSHRVAIAITTLIFLVMVLIACAGLYYAKQEISRQSTASLYLDDVKYH